MPPLPVEVVEHQVQTGWCSYCHSWRETALDLTGQMVGQGRVGVRIAALIPHKRLVLRMLLPLLQRWLRQVHGVVHNVRAISDVLRRVEQQGQP